jgi:hypothetical protein
VKADGRILALPLRTRTLKQSFNARTSPVKRCSEFLNVYKIESETVDRYFFREGTAAGLLADGDFGVALREGKQPGIGDLGILAEVRGWVGDSSRWGA